MSPRPAATPEQRLRMPDPRYACILTEGGRAIYLIVPPLRWKQL